MWKFAKTGVKFYIKRGEGGGGYNLLDQFYTYF